jgi:hypothetical protein
MTQQLDFGLHLLLTELRNVKTTWCSPLTDEMLELINKLEKLIEETT